MADDAPLLMLAYTAEPDIVYEFTHDGMRYHFGRDEERCEIVIWSAINGDALSRVAGCVWRMEDELWVRNLSMRHELFVEEPGRPAEAPLPPRRDSSDRGPARALPGELCSVRAPGGCELLARQVRAPVQDEALIDGSMPPTVRAPAVPPELTTVAALLCEPLLAGGQLPATYGQIAAGLETGSLKRVRNLVTKLCSIYEGEIPALKRRVEERMQREQELLGLRARRRLRAGVWAFDQDEGPAVDESSEEARRRALALPDYFEVAHLLVRRGLVTTDDVAGLTR